MCRTTNAYVQVVSPLMTVLSLAKEVAVHVFSILSPFAPLPSLYYSAGLWILERGFMINQIAVL